MQRRQRKIGLVPCYNRDEAEIEDTVMITIQVDFDQLLKAVDQLSDEQKHTLSAYLDDTGPQKKQRILGLHPGAFQPGEDFNDPLPDEFWFGEA
jgi:hypothetical protein